MEDQKNLEAIMGLIMSCLAEMQKAMQWKRLLLRKKVISL